MAKRRNKEQSQEVLQTLKSWTDRFEIVNDPLIDKLVLDIESEQNLQIWAEMNPDKYLPVPESISYLSKMRLVNNISGIRNLLVFTPVALTWASISVATSAFAKYEEENPNALVNFLQFWQQGFGYLNNFWTLSNVAIFDAVLVIFVIFLTYLVNILSRKINELSSNRRTEMEKSRAILVYELNRFFYGYKYPSVSQINKNIYASTNLLNKTLKSLNKIVARLEKDVSKYPNSAKIISELNSLTKIINKLSKK